MVGVDLRDREPKKFKDGRHVGLDFYDLLIKTTERYLGSRQNLKEAVNDRLGLDE
jgi:hypothetical protein